MEENNEKAAKLGLCNNTADVKEWREVIVRFDFKGGEAIHMHVESFDVSISTFFE